MCGALGFTANHVITYVNRAMTGSKWYFDNSPALFLRVYQVAKRLLYITYEYYICKHKKVIESYSQLRE
ncbi:hypothetical protein DSECCO2_164340 [anaerobic digester metagenome]